MKTSRVCRTRCVNSAEIYDDPVEEVKHDFINVSALTLMFDGWTDKHYTSYCLGLQVQFICDDTSSCIVNLSVKFCASDFEIICEHTMSEIKPFIRNY